MLIAAFLFFEKSCVSLKICILFYLTIFIFFQQAQVAPNPEPRTPSPESLDSLTSSAPIFFNLDFELVKHAAGEEEVDH